MKRRGFLASLPIIAALLPKLPRWLSTPPTPVLPGPILRTPAAYYAAGYSEGAWRLWKNVGGAHTAGCRWRPLAAFPADTPKAGDVVRLEHVETGDFLIGINGHAVGHAVDGQIDDWDAAAFDEALKVPWNAQGEKHGDDRRDALGPGPLDA
jgi:hypothetical protein